MDNDINRVKALVEEHPEIVNIKNSSDETPLYMATYFGYLPIDEYLITYHPRQMVGQKHAQNGPNVLREEPPGKLYRG